MTVLLFASQVPEPLLRLDHFLKSHPNIEADLAVSTSRGNSGQGKLTVARPNGLLSVVTFPDTTYTIISNPKESLISSSRLRQYELLPWSTGEDFVLSPLIVDDFRMSLPYPLFSGEIIKSLPKDAHYRIDGSAMVHGVKTDNVFVVIEHPTYHFYGHFYIDSEGKLLKFAKDMIDTKPITVTTEVSNYKYETRPASDFTVRITSGYVPEEFPIQLSPIGMDHKVPSGKLVDSGSGASADLASLIKSSGMFAIVDGAWVDSASGQEALSKVRSAMKADGGPLVLISEEAGKGTSSKEKLYRDPTGKLLAEIRAMGSPMFFLVNKKNVVERLWYGYNPSDEHFLAELKEAIAHPGTSRPDN